MAYSAGGESSSSSGTYGSTPPWKYDVFLSFAGKDTRLKFTGHLDAAFTRSGIKTFRDDVDLEKGEDIKQGLFQAIQDSLCAVLIISKNYAESSWCLEELEKILESRETLGRRVIPIFYDANPGDVKHLRGSFGEAMAKHEKNFIEDREKVENWKNVLSQIGSISGEDTRGRHEADLIKNIVGDVWAYLCSKLPSCDDNLVGIESRVLDMMPLLEIGLDDKRFVGIWGMGGVGKTTVARAVFEKLSYKFEVRCFLSNVRETLQREGIVSLQKKLLSHLKIKDQEITDGYEGMKKIRKLLCNKKVLLVLDDLDDMCQLKNLAQSPDWFGKGSRIIITTRDSQLLTSSRIYEMKTMKKVESLKLFSNKAFHKDYPEENYLELSGSMVEYTGGLPLALEVLGSFLCGRSADEWRDALDRLKKIPNNNILQVLKISYDVLNEEEKTIFLDIACFFKGWEKKEVTHILKCCDLHPTIGIKVLIEKTLIIETENCRLEMHDLLQDLGRYIVYQESPESGKRSRLWNSDDIKEVLENNKGGEAIQAIVMQDDYRRDRDKIKVHPEAFLKMSNIRLLILNTKYYYCPLILPRGSKISDSLKVVRWPSFPLEALPLETPLDKLVHIEMEGSQIKQLWNGIQFMNKLKFMNLSNSGLLIETPDFSRVPYLQHLSLRKCYSLVKVHPSLGQLKELAEVHLRSCGNLEILPTKLETNSLLKLDLSWCEKVAVLPEFGEGMKRFSYLDVSYTAITRLPESLGSLTGLRDLNLSDCKILNFDKLWKTHITHQISGLNATFLRELDLSNCGLSDGSIPDDFGSLSSLIALKISGNDFVNLPTGCFSSLFRLLFLSLHYCESLKSLPMLPPRLIQLNASRCNSMESLTDRQLWNLVATLDHENRGRTKYVISDEEYYDVRRGYGRIEASPQPESLPLRDFSANIPGYEIPSWFPNKEYYPSGEKKCVMKVNIPGDLRDSKWFGIVVCLHISSLNGFIFWSSKAAEDDAYIFKDWAHFTALGLNVIPHLCMMVLELNEQTCWQHLRRSHHNSLHIRLSLSDLNYHHSYETDGRIWGCGWKLCNLNDFGQLTQTQLATPDEVNLPWKLLREFIGNNA